MLLLLFWRGKAGSFKMYWGAFRVTRFLMGQMKRDKYPKSPVESFRHKPWTPARLRTKARAERRRNRNTRILREGEDALYHLNQQAQKLLGEKPEDVVVEKTGDRHMWPIISRHKVYGAEPPFPGYLKQKKRDPSFEEWEDPSTKQPPIEYHRRKYKAWPRRYSLAPVGLRSLAEKTTNADNMKPKETTK